METAGTSASLAHTGASRPDDPEICVDAANICYLQYFTLPVFSRFGFDGRYSDLRA